MNKNFVFILTALFLASAVIAYPSYNMYSGDDHVYKERITYNYYSPEDKVVVSRTHTAYYDNEDRHSTYDYRWGYSYRMTSDYWNKHYNTDNRRVVYVSSPMPHAHPSVGHYGGIVGFDNEPGKRMQLEYNPYRDRYESRTCYTSPPEGKLFYIKCR